jgi:hypothetical protein
MEGRDVLQHLLRVESEAASLSTEAVAEADRRVAERERFAREAYAKRYDSRVAELNAAFETEAASIAAEYRRKLDAYREALELKSVDYARFAEFASDVLSRDH